MDDMPKRLATIVYRRLLGLLPPSFREPYEAAMGETFRAREEERRRAGGLINYCRFIMREIGDLLLLAAGLRLNALRESAVTRARPRLRKSTWLFFQEIRPATRRLAASPGFTLVATTTLALGIGAATAVFSVVHSVILRPLPYSDSERLVRVQHTAVGMGFPVLNLSKPTYRYYREHNRVFEDIGLYRRKGYNLTGDGEPERIVTTEAAAGLFGALRVEPLLGRRILESDERPEAAPVVLLSHALWKRRFGGDQSVIGKTVELDDVTHEIVGVMPPSFRYPSQDTQLWIALHFEPNNINFQLSGFYSLARLRPGVDTEAARANLDTIIPGMTREFPGLTREILDHISLGTRITPLRSAIAEDTRPTLWLVFGSVGFLLLIACANVANLFLVRAEGSQRDVAVRTVLGAGRFQILRYRLTESLILSSLAGALSLGLAHAALRVVAAYGTNIPRLDEVRIDSTVLLFTTIIACVVGLFFSLLPHFRVSGTNWAASLRDGARGITVGSRRLRTRDALVVIQMALALVLLVGSGLVVRSFLNLRSVDPGFNPRCVLTLRLSLPATRYPTQMDAVAAQQRILDGIGGLPGVEAVGIADCLPLLGCTNANTMEAEDFPLKPNELPPKMAMSTAGPGYFRAMGIPLVKGRGFEPRDHEERTGAMVISQAVAARFWPTDDPIGKRIFPGLRGNAPWYTIVGVVGSIRQDDLSEPPAEIMYLPMVNIDDRNYSETRNIAVVIRTAADPLTLTESARRVIASVDPELPIANVQTMEEILARSLMGREFTMLLLSVAAVTALFLGAIGLYGTVSFLVGQRSGEIGMRMALGARAVDVLRMVLYKGGVLACMGLTIGLLSAWALTRVLRAVLFEVNPMDPFTYFAVSCLLLGVASIASYVPARRASRIDPMEALRSE